jgi:signal transduction histidine kinase
MHDVDWIGREAAAVLEIEAVPHILDIVCRTAGVRFAAIARVTPERWIACATLDRLGFGLGPGDELDVTTTICHEVRSCRSAIAIDDVELGAAYRDHPTPRRYGFRSYISMPIIRQDGAFFGTLCAIDSVPRALNNPGVLAVFSGFAELLAKQIDARAALALSQHALRRERETSRLREEFLAVLGHDLRNPLAAVASGTRILAREAASDQAKEIAALMQASIRRMSDLVDNLLDLAQGRLGGGIGIEIGSGQSLQGEFEQVLAELRATATNPIELDYRLDRPVACDAGRMGQLLSNLVANAIAHSMPGAPVRIEAWREDGQFRLAVANRGEPIPAETLGSLFQPFFRGAGGTGSGASGLGLGLYIAAEIARAHGGELTAESTVEATRFTMRMPLG